MKKLLIGLSVLVSFSAISSEIIQSPNIKGLDVVCSSDMNLVCKHLGYSEAIEYKCKKKIRSYFKSMETMTFKSVEIKQRHKSCEESGWLDVSNESGNSLAELQLTADVKCYTYAKFGYETKKTQFLKEIECI